MKIVSILILVIILLFSSCIAINKNFDYGKLLTPKHVKSDIEDLKKSLVTKHYDINWEGQELSILKCLDSIKQIKQSITLDSFEKKLSYIINNIDDGHSRIIHQDSIKEAKINEFGFLTITDSISYIRIGNFIDTENIITTLEKLELSYNKGENRILIIDIRSNPGGSIKNVNRTLTCFLPSKTKIYEKVKVKTTSKFSILSSKILSATQNLRYFKYTGKKKINGSPVIYLWVNESIASGSLLLSYHLQNNGAFVIGKSPKGIFNTFGNPYRYKLKHSKIIYTLASIKINLTKNESMRMEDMLTPNYIPKTNWKLSDLVDYINERKNR